MQSQPSTGGPSKHRAPGIPGRPCAVRAQTTACQSRLQTTHALRSSHRPQSTAIVARARARDAHTSRALPYECPFADAPCNSFAGTLSNLCRLPWEASGHTVPTLNRTPMRPPRRLDRPVSGRESRLAPAGMQSASAARLHGLDIPDALHSTADVSTADVKTQRGRTHAPPDTHCQAPAAAARAGLPHAVPLSQSRSASERIPHARARAQRRAQRAKALPGSAARRAGVPGPAAAGAAQNGPARSLQSSSPRGRPRTGPPAHPTRPRAALPAARRGRGALQAEPSAI